MGNKKIKPVFVMNQEGTLDFEKQAVLDGIHELLGLAEADGVEVRDFGAWRKEDYKNEDGSLKPYQSVDWYIEQGEKASHNGTQLNAHKIIEGLWQDYWFKGGSERDGHTVLVVNDDMYDGEAHLFSLKPEEYEKHFSDRNDVSAELREAFEEQGYPLSPKAKMAHKDPTTWEIRDEDETFSVEIASKQLIAIYGNTNYVVGIAADNIGMVLSVNRYENLTRRQRYECIKTVTMHELGHVFKLPPDSRTENVEESLGKHCANVCIMRQGLIVPTDDIRMSEDRLKYGALCPTCKTDLKAYFKQDN